MSARWPRWRESGFALLLAVIVVAVYGPSLRFGLIWDDPRWYQQGARQSAWQIFTALPTYQFFRPLAILLNRQLVSASGVVNAPLAHAIQIGAHLVATLASLPVLRAFGFQPGHARLAALLFAVFPLAYQAVAWAAPQQPLTLMWVLLAAWAAHVYLQRKRAAWLGMSLGAYTIALLFQESALPFVFLFFWLWGSDRSKKASSNSLDVRVLRVAPLWANRADAVRERRLSNGWPLLHLGLALAYFAIWLSVPRAGGVTGQSLQPIVLGYLLQAVVFPLARLASGWLSQWPLMAIIGLYVGGGGMLALGAAILDRRTALWSCAWVAAGLLPVWAGLSWDYVQVGERVIYPASLGIAGLWAAVITGLWAARRIWLRALSLALLILILGVSAQHLWQMQPLYQSGTQFLATTVSVLSGDPQSHLLFVNYPDRIEMRPSPYPLGVWGLTLAPVVQNLSDYALAASGQGASDRSLAAFTIGASDREAWPYRVNMRGENTSPEALFAAALESDAVYLTDYAPDGSLRLRQVGAVRPATSGANGLARLGDAVQLVGTQISMGEALTVHSTWRCFQPLAGGDTLFVHFWKDGRFWGDADGDSLGGLIPLWAWQTGTEVMDIRLVDAARFEPGYYEVRVGIYNREGGARYPAFGPDGRRFPEDEVLIGSFNAP